MGSDKDETRDKNENINLILNYQGETGMTEEQKFLFDLNGFLIVENVLPEDQIERIKEQVYLMTHDPEKLPLHSRTVPGGELAALIDHPVVEGILHEILGPRLRLEMS